MPCEHVWLCTRLLIGRNRVQVSGEVRASRQPDDRPLPKSGVLWVRIPPCARNLPWPKCGSEVDGEWCNWATRLFWARRVQVRALVPQLRRCAWCGCAFVRRMARFDSVHRLGAFRASARVFLVGTRCPGQHRGKAPCDRSVSGKHVTSPWSQDRFESGRSLSARVV
jgi:hypothetical protein